MYGVFVYFILEDTDYEGIIFTIIKNVIALRWEYFLILE